MKPDRLIQMANSIGEFFAAWPDADEACRELAAHIERYWEPRMRRALREHLQGAAGEGLSDIVVQALGRHGLDQPGALPDLAPGATWVGLTA